MKISYVTVCLQEQTQIIHGPIENSLVFLIEFPINWQKLENLQILQNIHLNYYKMKWKFALCVSVSGEVG